MLPPTSDALPPNLDERLLALPRPDPMHHRRIQRLHIRQRVRLIFRLLAQVLIQPPVPLLPSLLLLLPQPLREILPHQRVRIEPHRSLRPLALHQPHAPQPLDGAVPRRPGEPRDRLREPLHHRPGPQHGDLVLRRRPLEEPEQEQDRQLRLAGEPRLVRRHHAVRGLAFERRDEVALPDVAAVRLLHVRAEQRQREAVARVLVRRRAQLLVRPPGPARHEQLRAGLRGEAVEPVLLHPVAAPRREVRHLDPAGEEAEARVLRRQLLDERAEGRVLELARLVPRACLQRLHPVEDQDRPPLPHALREPRALVPRGACARGRVPEPPERRLDERVRGREPVRPLAVERPREHPLRPAPPVLPQVREPAVDERALPRPAPGDDGGDVHAVVPALVEPGQLVLAAEEVVARGGEARDGDARLCWRRGRGRGSRGEESARRGARRRRRAQGGFGDVLASPRRMAGSSAWSSYATTWTFISFTQRSRRRRGRDFMQSA